MVDNMDGITRDSASLDVESGGSGGDSLAGYDYQIDVSVWLALDLMLANKLTQVLVLEPASQEDIEAKLEETEVGPLATQVTLNEYILVVQAKLRSGDAWTVAGLQALLKHGGDNRVSAAERLKDGNVRYLLVTSAALNGKTRGLQVRRAGAWPKATDMPKAMLNELPACSAGRVAVIGGLDEERLTLDIKRLLTERFRVPNARWTDCLKMLREEARMRISRGGDGRWRREELERIIHQHDGYLASTPELEHYVHPTNWSDLRDTMHKNHAVLIIGQSGTGKTLATRKLYEELRAEIPGLSHVSIQRGPHELRNDRTPSPVLYDIEDPWGRFDFDPASRPWNDQLALLLGQASHDRMIVATTRRDVAQATGALETVERWLLALEVEHYGKDERSRLYRTRIEGLSRDLQMTAADAESLVLSKLATPLEIQKFFDALRALKPDLLKNPNNLIAEAINLAHQDSIERTVIEQIQQRDDVRAAAIIWALMKAADKLSLGLLRVLEPELADKEPRLDDGVTPLVDFFVAARNLRAGEGVVTYYHPRVEAGIERTLKLHPVVVGRTLRTLIDLLVDPDGPGEIWGAGASARILAALKERLPDSIVKPSPASVGKIDSWLTSQLAQGGRSFEGDLKLAAAVGSSYSNVSELARYLLYRPDKRFGYFHCWEPPKRDDAWYARLRADQTTKPLLDLFIRQVLPMDRDDYPISIIADIERIASDLTPAFLDAAQHVVSYGVIPSADVIAEGALRDLDGFELVVDAAVAVLTPSDGERRKNAETQLAIMNEVYPHDYAEHLADDDSGYTADEFLQAYVKRVRDVKGWRHLAQHRHAEHLNRYWMRAVAHETQHKAPDSDEFAAVFLACYGGRDEEYLWSVLLRWWDDRYRAVLRKRVHDGHLERTVRHAALACLVEQASDELPEIVSDWLAEGRSEQPVELALDLARLQSCRSRDDEQHGAATDVGATIPPTYAEIFSVALTYERGTPPHFSPAANAALVAAKHGSEDVRRFRIRVARHVGLSVQEDICWILGNSDDDIVAVEAIEEAILQKIDRQVEAALDHRFAKVGARALAAIGENAEQPLPERLLAKAGSDGSPIRKALVTLLAAKPHPGHLPTLLRLAKDHWSSSSRYYGDDDTFPIAQAAVKAISLLDALSTNDAEELYAVAIATSDKQLQIDIFRLLTTVGQQTMQERLFDMTVAPGRSELHKAAATGLLLAADAVVPKITARITPEILTTQPPAVATRLVLLFSVRADLAAVAEMARIIAPDAKRRVLLVLMIWILAGRDEATAHSIEKLLPQGHPAVAWAFGHKPVTLDDAFLADIGDPATCAEVLVWMKLAE